MLKYGIRFFKRLIKMISIRLPQEVENELLVCAKELKKTKSKIVYEALILYLEDLQDYITAKKVLAKNNPTISHEDLKRELGI
jgi:predicted DNA-binding protein